MPPSSPLPSKIGVLLFPGFQLLDYAGPIDAFNLLSYDYTLTLYTIAATLDPVPTQTALGTKQGSAFSQSIVPTHTFESAPRDLDVLLIPGGLGSRGEGSEERMKGVLVLYCCQPCVPPPKVLSSEMRIVDAPAPDPSSVRVTFRVLV